jgi:hypothetical protein
VDVLLERRRVAVVDVEPGRARGELVRDLSRARRSRRRRPCPSGGCRGSGSCAGARRVDEADAEEVVLGRADHGPGTVPLYVQAGKKTPGAISSSSSARRACTRARAGLCGSARRRVEQRVEVVRAADGGRALADHRRVAASRAAPRAEECARCAAWSCPAASASPPSASFDAERRRSERRRRAEQRRGVSLAMPKL